MCYENRDTAYAAVCKERDELKRELETLKAADVTPVVYCSKCLHHNRCIAESNYLSENIENPYCCRGKRKDGDGK